MGWCEEKKKGRGKGRKFAAAAAALSRNEREKKNTASPLLHGCWLRKNPAAQPVRCPPPRALSQSVRRGAIHPRLLIIICFNSVLASLPCALRLARRRAAPRRAALMAASPFVCLSALRGSQKARPKNAFFQPTILPQVEFQEAFLWHAKGGPPAPARHRHQEPRPSHIVKPRG